VDVDETSVVTEHLDLETCVVLVDNAYGGKLVSEAGWHLCKQTRILRWGLL
jgi:nitrogen fixation protein